MGDCIPKEQQEYIEAIKKDCLGRTNMTEQEAWTFGFRCWQLGYAKKPEVKMGNITDEEIDAFGKFSDYEKIVIKRMYQSHPEGTFPNPICALH